MYLKTPDNKESGVGEMRKPIRKQFVIHTKKCEGLNQGAGTWGGGERQALPYCWEKQQSSRCPRGVETQGKIQCLWLVVWETG